MFVLLSVGRKNIVGTGYQMLNRHDLTGAALYKDNDVAEMIQPLRFEPKEEPQKSLKVKMNMV